MKKLILLTPSIFLAACFGQNDSALTSQSQAPAQQQQVSSKTAPNLSVLVAEQRHEDVQKIIVNVKHIEVHFAKKDKNVRYLLGTQLGSIDLFSLAQGMELELAQFNLPAGASIKHIRMILNESGHWLELKDGSTCELQTPSAQQSGLKINNLSPHQLAAGKNYALNLALDTKNIVFTGNGGCLLKPVLKMGGLLAINDDSTIDPILFPPEDGSNSDDPNNPPDDNSSDSPSDPFPEEEGSENDNDSESDDETIGDDEWDYTPIIDGVPTIIP
ncbi:MAG: DUF4382 domain-containing protein [Bdellovibrionia bacterium]